jgi:hypothetical protein
MEFTSKSGRAGLQPDEIRKTVMQKQRMAVIKGRKQGPLIS